MIEFYIRDVDFSSFKQFEPVKWTQSLSDLSSWSSWPKESLLKLRMSIDEVEFIPISDERHARHNIRRIQPLIVNSAMLTRHRIKTKTKH